MNELGFKTFEEFAEDEADRMINDAQGEEKLDLYNRYCEYNDDYDSMLDDDDDDWEAREDYIDDLDFDYNDMNDFIIEDNFIDLRNQYDDYICDILEEAKESMSPEDFSDVLKEYTTEEMIEKYPDVYENIECNYSNYIINKTDNTLER